METFHTNTDKAGSPPTQYGLQENSPSETTKPSLRELLKGGRISGATVAEWRRMRDHWLSSAESGAVQDRRGLKSGYSEEPSAPPQSPTPRSPRRNDTAAGSQTLPRQTPPGSSSPATRRSARSTGVHWSVATWKAKTCFCPPTLRSAQQ